MTRSSRSRRGAFLSALLLLAAGCEPTPPPSGIDAGERAADAGVRDGDGGCPVEGDVDCSTSELDGGGETPRDAGSRDGGSRDGGARDGGPRADGGAPVESELVAVGLGEYVTVYLKSDGTVWVASQATWPPVMRSYGLRDVVGVGGGQYHAVAWDAAGAVWTLDNQANAVRVPSDADGAPFEGNDDVKPLYRANVSLRDGRLFYWGLGDPLNQAGGADVTNPIALTPPPGDRRIVEIDVGSATTFGALTFLWGRAADGTVWQWDRSHTTPTQVSLGGKLAAEITLVGCSAFVVRTTDDRLYAWGYYGSYAGGAALSTTPADVTDRWTAAGVRFPLLQMEGNYNTLHIIDADHHLFASGLNTMGEVGNNQGNRHWRTATSPYQWDWANGVDIVAPAQIPGEYRQIQAGNVIAFYLYAEDMGGNWYSWGRNKSMSLGNGVTLPAYGGRDYATYPNALDVQAPTPVAPLTAVWEVVDFDPDAPQPPRTWAGINQYLPAGTTTTTLTGSASQQQPTAAETITTTFAWTQVSGAPATIAAPSSATTAVTGLTSGTRVFRLTSSSSNGLSSSREVTVVVD